MFAEQTKSASFNIVKKVMYKIIYLFFLNHRQMLSYKSVRNKVQCCFYANFISNYSATSPALLIQ